MEMLDLNTAWSAILSLVIGLLGYMMNEKFRELTRVTILLNKTREEVARDNVTQAEVERITDHIDQRFNRLEEKIDQLIRQKG
jgi:CHASE3 domain sensor protein